MIHRFLIFDRKFNCRIDRRYPLNQFAELNSINTFKPTPKIKISEVVTEIASDSCNEEIKSSSWNTLIVKTASSDSLINHLSNLELEDHSQVSLVNNSNNIALEHSQQLILGMTHSLKNMFEKLSPLSVKQSTKEINSINGPEGYSFSFKTSKYRLFYFESFTGWKLVMLTDCNPPINTTGSSNTITFDSVLKTFYSQILMKFLVSYPLGTIYTVEKSTETFKVVVKDDFLHRSGFLSKMDEFINSIDRYF